MRRSANTIFVRLLLFIFIASFSLWGVASYLAPKFTGAQAVTIGDTVISKQEFDERLRAYRQRLQSLTGKPIEEGTPEAKESVKLVLDGIIAQKLLDIRSHDLGVSVGDAALTREVASNPAFRNDKGVFDEAHFVEVLRQNGYGKRDYFISRREGIRAALLDAAFSFAPEFPESVMEKIHDRRFQERTADMVFVPYEAASVQEEPADADLQQIWQDNAETFRVPEYREVAYVIIGASDVEKTVPAGDDVLKPFFTERQDEYRLPEMREVIQYRFDDEAAASEAMKQILKGGPGTYARDPSGASDPYKDRREEAGTFARDELPATLRERVFAAREGTYTGPLPSPFGWHVLFVRKVIAAHPGTFDEVKDKVKADYVRKETDVKYPEFLQKVQDTLAEGANLAALTAKFGLKQERFVVDAKGKTVSGEDSELAEVTRKPLLDAAFASKEKNVASAPVMLAGDTPEYGVYAVSSINPSHVKALDEVRGVAAELWKKARRRKALETDLAALKEGAKDSEAYLAAVKEKFPTAERQNGVRVRRPSGDGGLPQTNDKADDAVAKAVFMTPLKGFGAAFNEAAATAAVFKVNAERSGKETAGPEMIATVREEWRRGFRDDFSEQYIRYLRKLYNVKINPDLM